MDLKAPKEMAKKTVYVAIGAPVVMTRKVKDFGNKIATDTHDQIDEYAVEGEKVTKQIKDRNVVEELEHRINIDKVQDRVEQLRDQLENTLNNWRESFAPDGETAPKKPAAPKPAAKKAPAKKAPASKATTTKAPAKKAPAKKASTTKASAKKTPATKAAATKGLAKAATKKVEATEKVEVSS